MDEDKVFIPVTAGGEISFYCPTEGEGLVPSLVVPEEGARVLLNGQVVGRIGKVEKLDSTFTIEMFKPLGDLLSQNDVPGLSIYSEEQE